MVEWYFYLDKGQAKGPFGKDEVLKAFEQGKLGALDLIYKEGTDKWSPAFELIEFQQLFKNAPKKAFLEGPRRSWVVLQKKKPEEGRGFRQVGPYSEIEIRSKIDSGLISYQDFVWKTGFTKWTKIKDVKDFSSDAPSIKVPSYSPDDEIDEKTLKSPAPPIQDKDVFVPQVVKKVPIEAKTKDLTRPWDPEIEINIDEALTKNTKVEVRRNNAQAAPASVEAKAKKSPAGKLKEESIAILVTQETPSRWMFRLLVFGLSLGFVVIVLVLSSNPKDYQLPKGWKERFPKITTWVDSLRPADVPDEPLKITKALPPKVPEAVPAPPVAQVAPVPVPPPEPAGEPQVPQRISAQLVNGDTIEIQTDGSLHFPIKARLFGQAGKIYSESGIYREVQVPWGADKVPRWSLKTAGLAKGDYLLMLTQDKVKKLQNIRVDDLNGKSIKSLSEAKKWQSTDFNRERRDLVYLSQEFLKLSQNLEQSFAKLQRTPPQWSKFYKAWQGQLKNLEKSRSFSSQLRSRSLPWYWYRLNEANNTMEKKALSYDRMLKTKKEMDAGLKSEDLTKAFAELKKEVLALKLYQ